MDITVPKSDGSAEVLDEAADDDLRNEGWELRYELVLLVGLRYKVVMV